MQRTRCAPHRATRRRKARRRRASPSSGARSRRADALHDRLPADPRMGFPHPAAAAARAAIRPRGHDVLFAKHSFGDALAARIVEPGIDEVELARHARDESVSRSPVATTTASAWPMRCWRISPSVGTGRFVCRRAAPVLVGGGRAPARSLAAATSSTTAWTCMPDSRRTPPRRWRTRSGCSRPPIWSCAPRSSCSSTRRRTRKRTALVRNGVDYERLRARTAPPIASPAQPLTIGYYGAIADWFDSDLVAAIARLRPRLADRADRQHVVGRHGTARGIAERRADRREAVHRASVADRRLALLHHPVPAHAAHRGDESGEGLRDARGRESRSSVSGFPELAPMREAGLLALAEGARGIRRGDRGAGRRRRRRCPRCTARVCRRRTPGRRGPTSIAAAVDALEPEVSIIVVTYNNRDLNELCLASLFDDTEYAELRGHRRRQRVEGRHARPACASSQQREPRLRIRAESGQQGLCGREQPGRRDRARPLSVLPQQRHGRPRCMAADAGRASARGMRTSASSGR